MSSKRRLSGTPSPGPTTIDGNGTEPKGSPEWKPCLVCGDKGRIINYGALSCQSCKTFFRRNGFRPEIVRPCTLNQSCEVNMQTRHNCTACRLAKCFAVGMSSDLIRKEDQKKVRISTPVKSDTTEHVPTQNITTTSQLTTMDLTQNDRSILSSSEWTVISNILHAYDTFNIVSRVCETIDDFSILLVDTDVKVIDPLELIGQIFTSMQMFISSLPDFQILTIEEQTSLFERNLYGVMAFYSLLFFRDTKIFYNVKCTEEFTNIYGSEMILLVQQTNDQLDPDATLIKLMLIIVAFSSHCLIINQNIARDSLLQGTFRLLGSQNVYVDLLWKYIVYRYGYNESIFRFSRLMQTLLCTLRTSATVCLNNEAHQSMVDTAIGKAKQSLTTNENEQIPLWGKIK